MKKKDGERLTLGDIVLNTLSVVLAFLAASFAGYWVTHGPPDLSEGVEPISVALQPFSTSRNKLGNYDTLDPIVTGSVTRADGSDGDASQAALVLFRSGQPLSYKLRTVLQNTAFVDISDGQASVTLPLEQGGEIPGIGKVLRFEKRKGKWIIVTNMAEISDTGAKAIR